MTDTQPKPAACWLCRVIGHQWTQRRRHRLDGVRTEDIVVYGCCLRCGEPTPASLEKGETE